LKIDRSFVSGVPTRSDSTAITTAIAHLAKALNLVTVAEGIESPEQLDALRLMGCDMGQGYLFSRPRPAEHFGADPAGALRVRRSAHGEDAPDARTAVPASRA
jgi:EAL domain-containing protein (putative c-di-GMP-specific phosphodiesterase class I)